MNQELQPSPVWDPAVLLDLQDQLDDADGALCRDIIAAFLQQGRQLVDRLERLAAAADRAGLLAGAHSLRGSTLTVGGTRLAELCGQLERGELAEPATDTARRVRQEFQALAEQLHRWPAAVAAGEAR